ncbi:MAG: MBL fold metallo-hydrolase [Bdellovibrionaceae bacterium]|nr:MBL fold metallo-hydrolase [Pseudobdellovibrionaceae bacterium]
MKITFRGATQTVTGSQTLFEHNGYCGLVDCGLFQGDKSQRLLNWRPAEDLKKIECVLLTHAHIDHSGLLPRLVSQGWRKPIYCTPSTKDLLKIMLLDSAHLQEEDARFANLTKHSKHSPALPLYTTKDAEEALKLIYTIEWNQWTALSKFVSFRFLRAGHILGSAILQVRFDLEHSSKLLTWSGDLGSGHSDILRDPVHALETDFLVLESTYGDRRVDIAGREKRLGEIISKVIGRGGTIVIPVFAVGRTQDLLVSLYRLTQRKEIPSTPIYLDSPMATSVTRVYLNHINELKESALSADLEAALSAGSFFEAITSSEESHRLAEARGAKIVLSASGMLQGGRVLHHLKNKLPDRNNGVLFVGYQGAGTKGRLLQSGIPVIRLHHQQLKVEAEIFNIDGYSAHADSDALINWVAGFSKKPQTIFLNHGEPLAQSALAYRLFQELGIRGLIPQQNEAFELAEN